MKIIGVEPLERVHRNWESLLLSCFHPHRSLVKLQLTGKERLYLYISQRKTFQESCVKYYNAYIIILSWLQINRHPIYIYRFKANTVNHLVIFGSNVRRLDSKETELYNHGSRWLHVLFRKNVYIL